MELGVEGKAVLVTGGSRGIGHATVNRFLAEGARVAIAARDGDRLEEAGRESEEKTGRRPFAVSADCSQLDEVRRMVTAVAGELGGLDILVNSIGAALGGDFVGLSEEDWQWSLDSKMMSQIWCCREALPHLRERGGGAIVNVIGHRGKQPEGRHLPAGVANSGLMNFTMGLAQVEAQNGVRVVGVNPAPVATRRLQGVFETEARLLGVSVEEASRRWIGHVPLARAAAPEEIGDVIVFLASERASFITGTVVSVDGGATRCL